MISINKKFCIDPFHPYLRLDFIDFVELSSMRSLNKYSVGLSQGFFVLFSLLDKKAEFRTFVH